MLPIVVAILLFGFVPLNQAQLTFGSWYGVIDASTFVDDVASGFSGILLQQDLGPLLQMLTCGEGYTMFLGYTMINQTVDTNLTYAFAIRDATKMPAATLSDLNNAVLAGTAMASVSVAINASNPIRTGGAITTSLCHYVVGAPDSYGNVIDQNDDLFIDFAYYFTSPVAAQNATFNAKAQSDNWAQL